MPQLDINIYLTNLFWFLLIFFTFYAIVLKSFLPILLRGFLYRDYTLVKLIENLFETRVMAEYFMSRHNFLENLASYCLSIRLVRFLRFTARYFRKFAFHPIFINYLNTEIYFELISSELNQELAFDFDCFESIDVF